MEYGLKNIFRIYDDKSKQNRYRTYVHGNTRTWTVKCETTRLPSFQVTIASDAVIGDVTVYLVDLDDNETDITAYFDVAGNDATLYVQSFTSSAYLIYNASKNLETAIPKGQWYLKIDVDSTIYYSEVFKVVNCNGFLKVSYYNTTDIDAIDYTNGDYAQFANTLLIDTKLTSPEYVFDEEGTEDGEGNFLPTFQKRTKRYKFVFYAPEYIADAVTLIPMHSSITIVTNLNETYSETITTDEFSVSDVSWTEMKGFAKISCEFRVDPVIKTYCANNVT